MQTELAHCFRLFQSHEITDNTEIYLQQSIRRDNQNTVDYLLVLQFGAFPYAAYNHLH